MTSKAYHLRERGLALDDSWDVIVVGGGPAGTAAAVAAARTGARTLLIESAGALGGMGTLGLVPWFCGYHDRKQRIARGLAERIWQECRARTPHLQPILDQYPLADVAIDPEVLKCIYDELAAEAGVNVLFHTTLAAVEKTSEGEVDAIVVVNKAGLSAFRAKVYVDGTGDGDLAARADASFEKGDENGRMQAATLCLMLANVDEEALARGPGIHYRHPGSPIVKALHSDKYPDIVDLHACHMKLGPGVFGWNIGHVYGVDNTDPENVSKGLRQGRRLARQYRDALAEFHPAFANCFLAATGSVLGTRETRRIRGDYYLTVEDYLARRSFPDEICRNAYGVDVHQSTEEEVVTLCRKPIPEILKEVSSSFQHLNPGESFGVPYRCLTPKGLRNVLVAGRCISTDRPVNGSIRIMAACLNTGEAAGVAASMAAAGDGDVHAVDTEALRDDLRQHGAWLP